MNRNAPNYLSCPDLRQHVAVEDFLHKDEAQVIPNSLLSKKMRLSESKKALDQSSQALGILT